jgi:hypothetical protein
VVLDVSDNYAQLRLGVPGSNGRKVRTSMTIAAPHRVMDNQGVSFPLSENQRLIIARALERRGVERVLH